MARIWMSGLEAGHTDVFDSIAGASISAAQVRTGSYSLLLNDVGDFASAAFPASKSEIFGRFAIRPDYVHFSGYGNDMLVLFDSAGDPQCTIQLQTYTGTIQVRRGHYNDTIYATGGILPKNRWHCVEFRLLVANAGGRLELKVDGTQVIDYTGDTQKTANANVLSFRFGRSAFIFANTCEGYYDDIAFNDILGGINDTWIGRGGIPAIFPIGAGFSTDLQLFPNTGEANWEDVDEKPPDDDTSYVFDTLIDDHDSYAASNLVAAGAISAVQWLARARSDLVGNPEIARILRIGGVDYQGADIGIDATYDYYSEILDQDPNAGPGAWTVAAVNGMELGVKIR